MITVKRKWKSHKTTPCKGYWLYQAWTGQGLTPWLKEAEYQAWKNYIISERF